MIYLLYKGKVYPCIFMEENMGFIKIGNTGKRIPKKSSDIKVLMINTVPMAYDGITTVMLNYTKNIDKTGLQVDFLANNTVEESLRAKISAMGADLYEIHDRNSHPVRYFLSLIRLIRKNGYNIVHAHGNSCTLTVEMIAAWLGGAKVRCPHSHNTHSTQLRAHRMLRPFFEHSYTHGFACGEAAGKWLFRNRPFTVLNNGTDTENYRFNDDYRREFRQKLNIGDRIAIGHVAHFTPFKNHSFLIDVFEKVIGRNPNFVLVLVGDGNLRPEIEEKVREKHLEDSIIFVGITLDIPQILSAMDFMVLPSLYEGLPNVLIEWQSSGLPSLVADTVTKESRLSDLISFLPLEEDAWVNAIMNMDPNIDRRLSSDRAIASITSAGYDIKSNAANLKSLYLQYAQKG